MCMSLQICRLFAFPPILQILMDMSVYKTADTDHHLLERGHVPDSWSRSKPGPEKLEGVQSEEDMAGREGSAIGARS